MDTMFAWLDWALAYLDDILIKRETRHQYMEDMKIVFERIKEYGFKISEIKCEQFMSRIKYQGQVIDVKGWRPDPARSSAIKDMAAPTNLTILQAFVGFANYYLVYIQYMHELICEERNAKVRLKRPKKINNIWFITNTFLSQIKHCRRIKCKWFGNWSSNIT